MALKEDPYALPLKLGGRGFTKATVCSANSCILGSYYDSPSIAWMSISPLVVDGEIVVLPKYNGWNQKCPLRAEWPYAVALFKRPGVAKTLSLFIYHLAEASYKIHKVPTDAQVALMMGYERVAVVFKDEIQVIQLQDPTRHPLYIPASIYVPLYPALCISTSDTLILTSANAIQQWQINTRDGRGKMVFSCKTEGFGFVEVVAFDNTIAAISEGGAKLHMFDTQETDPVDKETLISSSVPITKLYIDDDYIVTGLADGTMKLYDREQRLFLGQLNIIPVAARGSSPDSSSFSSSHTSGSSGSGGGGAREQTYLQHKISFLAKQEEFLIAAMLDPSQSGQDVREKQLEVSIWPVRGQNLVQPLKTKLLPGTVNFMHYDDRNARLLALTQYDRTHEGRGFGQGLASAAQAAIVSGGPLIAITWRPPFKSLLMNGIKWRETNDQLQAKLAQEVMEKVLSEPSFFRAMFMVDTDPEEIEQVVDSMFISLAQRESLLTQFVDTAIAQEIVLRRHGTPSPSSSSAAIPSYAVNTSSGSIPHSNQNASSSNSDSPNVERRNPQASSSTAKSTSATVTSIPTSTATEAAVPPQYFPPHSMTTSVLTRCLAEHSFNYMTLVLTKPLNHIMKSEADGLIYSLPSTPAGPEDAPMFTSLIKITSGIIDGLIENQNKISPALQRLLTSVHQAVCADNPNDSELKSFRRGAARVFLDYVVLTYWLEPVDYHLLNKIPDEVRHNLRVVAQLLQVIAGYSKHKLTDPALCSLVTEYSTKWRSWLLSRVSDSDIHSKGKNKDGKNKSKSSMSRANSYIVSSKGGNAKTAGLVVTKFIITHSQELLAYMTKGGNRSPDPCATRIRAISESLLMPIMSMMAKKGTKNSQLAASLRVFGKNGTGSGSGKDSTSTESSNSDEHLKKDHNNADDASHSSEHDGRSDTPVRRRRNGSSAVSSGEKVDSNSGDSSNKGSGGGGIPSLPTSTDGIPFSTLQAESAGSRKDKSLHSPRHKRPKKDTSSTTSTPSATPEIGRKRSSGSLTSSGNDDDFIGAQTSSGSRPLLGSPERRRIGIVTEVEEDLPPSIPSTSSPAPMAGILADSGETNSNSREGSLSFTADSPSSKRRKKSTKTKDKDATTSSKRHKSDKHEREETSASVSSALASTSISPSESPIPHPAQSSPPPMRHKKEKDPSK